MSSKRSSGSNKRKRREEDVIENPPDDSSSSYDGDTVFREWLDEGVVQSDGRIEHESFSMSVGDSLLNLSLGDTVWMRGSAEDDDVINYYGSPSKSDTQLMIARIEGIWEVGRGNKAKKRSRVPEEEGPYNFRARWFFKRQDVKELRGEFKGPVPANFSSLLTDDDLVLSNHADVNEVTTICGLVQVIYRRPDADKILPSMPQTTYVCRYSMSFGTSADEKGKILVTPFDGDNDEWEDFLPKSEGSKSPSEEPDRETNSPENVAASGAAGEGAATETASSMASSDSDSVTSERVRHGAMDEGTTVQRDTRVGLEYQVEVPEFKENQPVVSRKPTLVWKADRMNQEEIDRFLDKVGGILVPYLRRNKLTHEVPYSPLPWDELEGMVQAKRHSSLPTLSTVCTSSALSRKRNQMLRECDADAILKALHDNDYNTKKTLNVIQKSPRQFLTIWSLDEKEIFNSAFRRYAGSLRMIHKGLVASKDFRDIIDYHYRFKIPDQFRRFQEIKREQAVRMMECIETRRNINSTINLNGERNSALETTRKRKEPEWSKTAISDVTGAIDQRRAKAKELLLDVEEKLGEEKMAEVVDVIKHYHKKSLGEMKGTLVDIFKENPEFQKRFVEFLPRRFRL